MESVHVSGVLLSLSPPASLSALALVSFQGQTERELSFKKGDTILVSFANKHAVWWRGQETRSGRTGWFKQEHVSVAFEVEGTIPASPPEQSSVREILLRAALTAENEHLNRLRTVEAFLFEVSIVVKPHDPVLSSLLENPMCSAGPQIVRAMEKVLVTNESLSVLFETIFTLYSDLPSLFDRQIDILTRLESLKRANPNVARTLHKVRFVRS
jgi:hypothetical protein